MHLKNNMQNSKNTRVETNCFLCWIQHLIYSTNKQEISIFKHLPLHKMNRSVNKILEKRYIKYQKKIVNQQHPVSPQNLIQNKMLLKNYSPLKKNFSLFLEIHLQIVYRAKEGWIVR